MPADSRFVGNSIEELLVALAEGVREAQVALNGVPLLDPSGRPLATYQLPYLDFTIAVEVQTDTSSGGGRPIALFKPVSSTTQTDSSVKSTVAGRLIAAPPGDGLPVPRLRLTAGGNVEGAATITIEVSNSAGEVLAGQRLELNIDDGASAKLTAARSGPAWTRFPGTKLAEALLVTDERGVATTRLLIDPSQRATDVVVVFANIGPFNARGAVPLGAVA